MRIRTRSGTLARPFARTLIQAAAIAIAAAAACGAGAQDHVALPDPIPNAIPASRIGVALETVATGLVSPVAAAVAPGDRFHLYVADQPGQIWRVRTSARADGPVPPQLVLDLSSLLVSPLGLGPSRFDERGLVGIAFHPQFRYNGLFYTFTSQPARANPDFSTMPPGVAPNCQSVVTEWRVERTGNEDRPVALAGARELLRIDKPNAVHNGGALVFGPDQMLYISLGDGGGSDDDGVGHAPEGNAQSLAPGNVLGKILRIDPLGRNAANGKYGIPPDNPFVGREGADEIFAIGFRNPFRMSIARDGRVIVGDVGQGSIEEVDVVTAGGNYGWPIKEGSFLLDERGPGEGGIVYADSPGLPAGLTDPLAQYDHWDSAGGPVTRSAVIGGFVYQGARIPRLGGRYVFGDYSGRTAPSPQGQLFVLGRHNRIESLLPVNRNPFDLALLGFAQDARGELYVLANDTGSLLGNTGVVLKLVPAPRYSSSPSDASFSSGD